MKPVASLQVLGKFSSGASAILRDKSLESHGVGPWSAPRSGQVSDSTHVSFFSSSTETCTKSSYRPVFLVNNTLGPTPGTREASPAGLAQNSCQRIFFLIITTATYTPINKGHNIVLKGLHGPREGEFLRQILQV